MRVLRSGHDDARRKRRVGRRRTRRRRAARRWDALARRAVAAGTPRAGGRARRRAVGDRSVCGGDRARGRSPDCASASRRFRPGARHAPSRRGRFRARRAGADGESRSRSRHDGCGMDGRASPRGVRGALSRLRGAAVRSRAAHAARPAQRRGSRRGARALERSVARRASGVHRRRGGVVCRPDCRRASRRDDRRAARACRGDRAHGRRRRAKRRRHRSGRRFSRCTCGVRTWRWPATSAGAMESLAHRAGDVARSDRRDPGHRGRVVHESLDARDVPRGARQPRACPTATSRRTTAGTIVGFCSFWRVLDELHINNLARAAEPPALRRGDGVAYVCLDGTAWPSARPGPRSRCVDRTRRRACSTNGSGSSCRAFATRTTRSRSRTRLCYGVNVWTGSTTADAPRTGRPLILKPRGPCGTFGAKQHAGLHAAAGPPSSFEKSPLNRRPRRRSMNAAVAGSEGRVSANRRGVPPTRRQAPRTGRSPARTDLQALPLGTRTTSKKSPSRNASSSSKTGWKTSCAGIAPGRRSPQDCDSIQPAGRSSAAR